MRKVFLAVFILISFAGMGQIYQAMPQAGYGPVKRFLIDSVLTIPMGKITLRNITGGRDTAQIRYNIADSSMYVYSGYQWIKLGSGSSGWGLTGNAGTNPTTNFLGTTDAVRLDLRTNNTIRQSITGSGNVGIGTVTPSYKLDVYGSARVKGDGLGETFVVDSVDNINLQARSGTDPNYTDFNIDQANGFYFRKSGIDVLGNLANGASFMKSYDGVGSILVYPDSFHVLTNSTRRLTINSAGNIGIGTASPISKLHVTGTIRGTDSLILSGLGYGVGTQSLRRNGVTGAITWADTTAGGGGGTPSLTTNEIGIGVGGVLGSYATFNVDIPTFSLRLGQGDLTPTYVNFLGSNAGSTATNANRSNFLGLQAGNGATNADGSNFLGAAAGEGATNASRSNFLGTESGNGAANASSSNFLGQSAGFLATNASYSNFLGFRTGYDAINSSYSNLFGYNVGMASVGDTLGSNNIIIGTNISMPNGTANSMNLGAVLYGTGFYSTTTGTPRLTALTTGKIGINTSTPSTALHVIGAIKATDSVSFTGLLPMSASTDSVVVRDTNGKLGTTGSVVTINGTQTLTNKRWTARVGSTTSSATPTINTDNTDIYKLTAQSADITSFTTNLSGTPVDGDILEIQVTGTAARAITWGASFVSSTVALPTTTATTATLTIIFQYYTTSSYGNNKWICVNYY